MARLLTLGETMAVLATSTVEPLRTARELRLSTAGAESTVAIGFRRLGHDARWLGVVGADELGLRVRRDLAAEGVDVSFVRDHPDAPTGLMLRERRAGELTRVHYYRRGSAGAELDPADVTAAAFDGVDLLHLTGITAALGDRPRAAVDLAVTMAAERGLAVSYDVNHRSRLGSADDARARATRLLPVLDVLFVSTDDLALLTDADDPVTAARSLLAEGPAEVVVTRGAAGAVAVTRDGAVERCMAVPVPALDPVGAGDSFAAGYLAARCDGRPLAARLADGAACAAFTVSTPGDWEGLPTRAELGLLGGPAAGVLR